MELKLYELAEEFAALVDADDLDETALQRLDATGHAIEVKADNICSLVKTFDAFVEMCKKEEARIAEKRRVFENKTKKLTDYLQRCMELAGTVEISAGTRTVKLQKKAPALVVDNEVDIPARFWTIIPETKQLDRKGLLAARKQEEIQGCHVEQGLRVAFK